ncbi:hypothetical protein C4D60_Mb00t07090 [Musa balbisiana]|uniref:Uncharacterized protein n=1 Tax=Musa balbisiana TaxID=52838 RepID=A0A4S8I5Y5_MUSBA|nr:hypothetical protein C4D60_Mb00t07090 [Musa balbisiana]
MDEVHARAGPDADAVVEQRALGLEAEVERLWSELQASTKRGVELQTRLEAPEGNNAELQTRLRASVAEARSARADSLELIRRLEESRAEARRASKDLEAEIRLRPEKDKKLIEDYKGSSGFQLGLVRTGRTRVVEYPPVTLRSRSGEFVLKAGLRGMSSRTYSRVGCFGCGFDRVGLVIPRHSEALLLAPKCWGKQLYAVASGPTRLVLGPNGGNLPGGSSRLQRSSTC